MNRLLPVFLLAAACAGIAFASNSSVITPAALLRLSTPAGNFKNLTHPSLGCGYPVYETFVVPKEPARSTAGIPPGPPANSLSITCPADTVLTLGPGACDLIFEYEVLAFDDTLEIDPVQWAGLASGEVFPLGTTVSIFVVEDLSGNTSDCSFSVTVVADTTALTCQDTVTAYLGPDCWVLLAPEDVLTGDYGCAQNIIVDADRTAPFGDGPWGAAFFEGTDRGKVYAFRATDLLSSSSCTGTVRVLDTLPPALTCPTVTVPCMLPTAHLTPTFLRDSLGIFEGFPDVFERCPGDPSIFSVDVHTDYGCDSAGVAGIVTRFWTALDASNNVSTCVQTIVLERSADAVFFPDDGTFNCTPLPLPAETGWPYFEINGYRYALSDTSVCGIVAEHTDAAQVFCGANRLINRLWTVQDACDALADPTIGAQIIEVLDEEEPVLNCPAEIVVFLLGPGCEGTIDLPDLIVGDACSPLASVTAFWNLTGSLDSLTAELSDFAGNDPAVPDTLAVFGEVPDFPVGTTTITLVATDVCGNAAECQIDLIVWDSEPPVAVCDTFLTAFLDDMGRATMPAGLFDDGSSDACSQVFFKARRAEPGTCDTLDQQWDDFVRFCCADFGDTVSIVLRVYDIPVPDGVVADTFAAGQFATCTTPIAILDLNPPQCMAPADTVVACEIFDPALAGYGDAGRSCVVDSVAMLLNYQQFDTVCSRGTIVRTFRVFDALGNSGQCTQRIIVKNDQHYFVRFPDDLVIMACDTSGNYGAPEFLTAGCENMVATFTETTVYNALDACFRIERTWKVFNACAYDSTAPLIVVPNPDPNLLPTHPDNAPGPVVSAPGTTDDWAPTIANLTPNAPTPTDFSTFWAADANGYSYKQIIRVIDLEEPIIEDCPTSGPTFTDNSANDLFLWNANFSNDPGNPAEDLCEGAVDLRITATDACFGPKLGVDFLLFLDLDGDDVPETVLSSTDLPLPGTVQYNNLNTPNYSGGLPRTYDSRAVPPNAKYQFALRADTVGRRQIARIVWHQPAVPGSDQLPQLPLGNHRVRWTVYDDCGNETTCEYAFRVETPSGTCAPTVLTIAGSVRTETGAGIADVAVQLSGTHPVLPAFTDFALTDAQGAFTFTVPTGASYGISPFRDDDPLNGVSTFDLLTINKHVLGLEALASPYKIIAADANKSNTVTTFDIVELRKLILGLYQELPNLPSWRFVPANHVFSNPDNPFAGGLPEQFDVTNLQPGNQPVHDFIGLKVGDANGNANPSLLGQETEARNRPALHLDVLDRAVAAGEVVAVSLRSDQPVLGLQGALRYAGLELLDITPSGGFSLENTAAFPDEHLLTFSWDHGGVPVLDLHFRALEAGRLRDMLLLTDRKTRSEAYSADLDLLRVALRFGDSAVLASEGLVLFQNRPNPFSEATHIGFYLPQAKPATLRVLDATGRLLWSETAHYEAGFQTVIVPGAVLGGAVGVLYYQLETDTEQAVRRMVRY